MKARKTTEGKDVLSGEEEAEKDKGNVTDNGAKKFEKDNRRRTTLPRNAPQLCPNSFLCSDHQIHATYPRPPTVSNPPSHLRPHNQARGHPTVPFWICPTRLPNLYHQPDWNQSVPVRYRKTRGGRTRAVSMNLDLELCRSEDRIRGCRAERVEVITVIEGAPGQHGCVGVPQGSIVGPGSIEQKDPLPHLVQESPPLSSSSSGWIDKSSLGSQAVVLRRSALGPRDKTRAWRRHTVVV